MTRIPGCRVVVTGHVGCGHAHSHGGLVQDDSAGFCAVMALFQEAVPLGEGAFLVDSVEVAGDSFVVRTLKGGTGRARARRGITPFEADLASRARGKDASFCQAVAMECFGRLYGQGASETPVALETALALACVDAVHRNRGRNPFFLVEEDVPGNVGRIIGGVFELGSAEPVVPVGLVGVVNATSGGIGPNEDLEGNVARGAKGEAMASLGMTGAPTIVLESKAYVPGISDKLSRNAFLVRSQEGVDNAAVARSLEKAAQIEGFPVSRIDSAFPRRTGALRKATEFLAERVCSLAKELSAARASHEKVRIVSELLLLLSQDAGGCTFMSDGLHDEAGSAGLEPGTAAVLSLAVTAEEKERFQIPIFAPEERMAYVRIAKKAASLIGAEAPGSSGAERGRGN